jgi:N-methylhydantoinase B
VRLETPGGGGWGDPLARPAALVARDVRLGYISPTRAREDYKVGVASDGRIDETTTAMLRGRSAA